MQEFFDVLVGNTVSAPEIYTADIVALNLLGALLVGVIIGSVYKTVHKGISYSQSYVYSIVIVTMVVALAMMVIGNDITRAFALLGTFTIIRYRTAVKDPRDTAFIFVSLVLGLAVGSSNYGIAISGTVVMSLAALLLDRFNFGAATKLEQVLYMTVDAKKFDQSAAESTMKKALKSSKLLNANYAGADRRMTYTYNITTRADQSASELIDKLTKVKGIEDIEVLASQNLVEF
jgi:uncharacterized membrane protein YhiD involved in acid resistance